MLNLIAAARARRKPSSGRGFWLESAPLPKVLPGQGLGDGDDEVQSLVADGPGDESAREYWIGDPVRVISDPPDEVWTRYVGAVVSKKSIHGTDAHEYGVLFDDAEETVRHFWTCQLEPAPEGLLPTAVTRELSPAEEEAARLHAGSLSSPMLTPPAAVTVALDNRTAVFTPAYAPGALRGPTPLADDLRRDWELLEWANGRLVTRVRLLEAQLRAAGIEPAARE